MKLQTKNIVTWICQIVAAAILAQTLFFKFTAHPESVKLFSELGIEPLGRIGIGSFELVAVVLLLISKTAVYGAVLSIGLMSGAIVSHFTHLGWDGARGELGMMAVIVWIASVVVIFMRRYSLLPLLKRFGIKLAKQ